MKGMRVVGKDVKAHGHFPTVNIFHESDTKRQTQVGRIYGVQFNEDRMLCGVYRNYTKDTEDRIINLGRGNLDFTLDE